MCRDHTFQGVPTTSDILNASRQPPNVPPRVGVLAIETSNPTAWVPGTPMPGVCVGVRTPAGVELRSVEACDPGSREDMLMPAIDRAMRAAGLQPADLGLVAVSVGPGGFTAVRIAVTVARMIAEVSRAAVVAVPSALVAAASAPEDERTFAVVLASKGDDAFVTRFERPLDPKAVARGEILRADDLDSLAVGMLVADAFLPAAMRAWAESRGVAVVPSTFDPRECLRLAVCLPTVDVIDLAPIYPREPEAVRKWRELHPRR